MDLLDLTLPTMAANLALDEALLVRAEAGEGGELLRLWEWPHHAVVLGSGGVINDDVDLPACERAGISLWRRSSGGGTVLLGSGCLLFSLVLAYERSPLLSDINRSYRYILERLLEMIPGATLEGVCDLTLEGRKFSGNAQQRKRGHLLHHGTLLYDFKLPCLSAYLKPPPRQPEYRAGRPHTDFVCNLPFTGAELRGRLVSVWGAETHCSNWPQERVQRLVDEKYGRAEWIKRR